MGVLPRPLQAAVSGVLERHPASRLLPCVRLRLLPNLRWAGTAPLPRKGGGGSMTRRQTGFPPVVRSLIYDRSGGACERCGERHSDSAIHHRRPRQAGGTRRPETNYPSNAGLLCGQCHREVESYRTQAFEDGWLVRQSHSPAEVPVLRRGVLCLLDDVGGFSYTERTAS